MKAKNVTIEAMQAALVQVNKRYNGNVEFESVVPKGKHIEFTLRVKSSFEAGHRLGFTGRRMPKACWHVHGHFFDALLKLAPDAVIISRGWPGGVISRDGGNWQDCNIGSLVQPLMFSEACECKE